MTSALAPRRMLLGLVIAVTALLFVGAGQALAAQRPSVSHRTTAVHHRAVAYADGTLTVVRHHARKRAMAHANLRSMVVVHRNPVAYADGVLTHAHPRRHHRRFLAHPA